MSPRCFYEQLRYKQTQNEVLRKVLRSLVCVFFLNDLVRFVPTLGRKNKVFMVPMIYLRLHNPQGRLEENFQVTQRVIGSAG